MGIFWVGLRATGGQGRLKALVARVNERAIASLPGQIYKPTHPPPPILQAARMEACTCLHSPTVNCAARMQLF